MENIIAWEQGYRTATHEARETVQTLLRRYMEDDISHKDFLNQLSKI